MCGLTAMTPMHLQLCQSNRTINLSTQALIKAHYLEATEARKRLAPPSNAALRCAQQGRLK